jgi:hypothetical protein
VSFFDLHEPKGGSKVSAAMFAQLMREVRKNRLLESPGVRLSRSPNGTHLLIDLPRRSGSAPSLPRPFDPVYGTGGVLSSLAWPYYQAGGYTRKMSTNPAIPSESGIVALKYDATLQTDQATIEVIEDPEVELPDRSDYPEGEEGDEDYKEALQTYYDACLGAIQEAQSDQHYVIVPLYLITNSKIVLDMRPIPHVQVAEVVQ